MPVILGVDLTPLLCASFIFLSVLSLGIVLFYLVNIYYESRRISATKYVYYDFIQCLLICTFPFGYSIILAHYGRISCAISIVVVNIIRQRVLPYGETSPVEAWSAYLIGTFPLGVCIKQTIAHILAAILAYQLGIILYRTELHEHFSVFLKDHDAGACKSALQTTAVEGFLIEAAATMYIQWMSLRELSENSLVDQIMKASNTAAIVMGGFHLTGMFMNPVKAMAYTATCEHVPHVIHLFVYWLGPLVGSWITTYFFPSNSV